MQKSIKNNGQTQQNSVKGIRFSVYKIFLLNK